MAPNATSHGARSAGLLLAELLRDQYKPSWYQQKNIERSRATGLHNSAIALVLANHLHDHPRESRKGDDRIESPQLTPVVSRALRGERLSRETLELFIAAFRIRDEHAERLRRQWHEIEPASIVVGTLPPPDDVPGYQPRSYDTLMLHEHHWLGADGLPNKHRTLMNIRARADGMESYQYRIDTPHARVTIDHGGHGSELYELGAGLWAVDMTFPRPLQERDTHYMEFWTDLRYDEPPPREMRRATHERTENLDIRVEFHPQRLPSSVCWAEWAHYREPNDQIVYREEYELDSERAVHRVLEVVERAVVGFVWEWQ